MGLLQRDLAGIIGVDESTIHNWECSHSQPQDLITPRIIEFLEYNPFSKDSESGYPKRLETFGHNLRMKRIYEGITQKYLAQILGVSVDAIRDWESDRTKPQLENRKKLFEFLAYDP